MTTAPIKPRPRAAAVRPVPPPGTPPADPLAHITPPLRPLAVPVAGLVPDPENVRRHPEKNLAALRTSITQFGQTRPLIVQRGTNIVAAGNATLAVLKDLGHTHAAVTVLDLTDDDRRRLAVLDNRTADLAEWDYRGLGTLLAGLQDRGVDPGLLGWTDAEVGVMRVADFESPSVLAALARPGIDVLLAPAAPVAPVAPNGSLADRFGVPPFSVLDARQGYWQDRKRAWLALGIQSELGRGGGTWVESAETGSPLDRQAGYHKPGTKKPTAIPGGGGAWLGGPRTASSGNYKKSRANATPGGVEDARVKLQQDQGPRGRTRAGGIW